MEKTQYEPSEWNYVTEIAKNPANPQLYVDYQAYLRLRITELAADRHYAQIRDYWNKIGFLEAQDAEDYEKMNQEAATLNPSWLAIVSRPPIVNCGRHDPSEQRRSEKWWQWSQSCHHEKTLEEWQANHPAFRMDFVCTKKWNEMVPTENRKVRFCEGCAKNVYFCDNIMEARELGNQGCCIGIDVGIQRRENDLCGEISMFGTPRKSDKEKEEQRRMPDRISAKRIAKKMSLQMIGQQVPTPKEYDYQGTYKD